MLVNNSTQFLWQVASTTYLGTRFRESIPIAERCPPTSGQPLGCTSTYPPSSILWVSQSWQILV